MSKFTYKYDTTPTGRYDVKLHHCVTKYKDGEFEWCFTYPTREQALSQIEQFDGKDIEYPGKRR